MHFQTFDLEGVILFAPDVFKDDRGSFHEPYNKRLMHQLDIPSDFCQINQSVSTRKHTLRGLHFQKAPYTQAKLIRVVKGLVYDVIVDLRKDSSTKFDWDCFLLTEENNYQLYVPKGFAHGFCTMEPDTVVIYKNDEYYHPEAEGGIRWDDPDLNIVWPTENPIINERDNNWPLMSEGVTEL